MLNKIKNKVYIAGEIVAFCCILRQGSVWADPWLVGSPYKINLHLVWWCRTLMEDTTIPDGSSWVEYYNLPWFTVVFKGGHRFLGVLTITVSASITIAIIRWQTRSSVALDRSFVWGCRSWPGSRVRSWIWPMPREKKLELQYIISQQTKSTCIDQ